MITNTSNQIQNEEPVLLEPVPPEPVEPLQDGRARSET
jgi:hypothetical protein